jgi:succinoglycan biosynthesis protein ExoL
VDTTFDLSRKLQAVPMGGRVIEMGSSRAAVRIVALLPILGDARDARRVAMLQEIGFDVSVVAFERPYYPGRMPTVPITSLGRIEHGRYLRRAVRMLSRIPRLRRLLRGAGIVYASGPDMALFAIVASVGLGPAIVLDVSDLRRVQVARGIGGALVRFLDRQIANRSRLLVVTAIGFAQGYYRDRLGSRTPWLLVENKLHHDSPLPLPPVRSSSSVSESQERIRIGYFGVLRCRWSWETLREIVRRSGGRFEVVMAGYCTEPGDLPEQVAQQPHMKYLGTYRSPQDLPALYGGVDLVWACYPGPEHRDPEWRWALAICRSTRFYEGCHYKTPLISLAESADGAEVARLGIGIALADNSIDAIWKAFSAIDRSSVARWRERMSQLPASAGLFIEEPLLLRTALMGLVK